ncbi:MAG: CTP synthase, partial [Nanoarchaeota archaeon]|nr:CTP synthase [Nanoarchaeota archaeon]
TPKIKKKISIFCDVEEEAVITGLDVDSVYKIPIVFDDEGVGRIVSKILDVKRRNGNVAEWKKLIENWENAKRTITIAMCGKYTDLEDSYASINEALMHCGAHLNAKVKIKFIETTHTDKVASQLEGVDGVIVPGGFGGRGIEGKIEAVKVCREKNVPFLGLCYGLQMAVIEFARNVCGLEGANTTEVDNKTKHPVIAILEEQKDITTKGATMRLGAYPAKIEKGTKVHALYKSDNVSERHRHRYEVNPKYHKILSDKGLVFSGMSPDRKLVEFIELPDHKYFIGTQAHPELKSSLPKPAPLFYGFIKACLEK